MPKMSSYYTIFIIIYLIQASTVAINDQIPIIGIIQNNTTKPLTIHVRKGTASDNAVTVIKELIQPFSHSSVFALHDSTPRRLSVYDSTNDNRLNIYNPVTKETAQGLIIGSNIPVLGKQENISFVSSEGIVGKTTAEAMALVLSNGPNNTVAFEYQKDAIFRPADAIFSFYNNQLLKREQPMQTLYQQV